VSFFLSSHGNLKIFDLVLRVTKIEYTSTWTSNSAPVYNDTNSVIEDLSPDCAHASNNAEAAIEIRILVCNLQHGIQVDLTLIPQGR
jgi:hypothetical protein